MKTRYMLPVLVEAKKRYDVIRDCLAGEIAVKAATVKYLPVPNDGSPSEVQAARYVAYLLRAVFYNVTKRTLDGLCGQIFMRDPVVSLPSSLTLMLKDADGGGVSLVQLAKKATYYTLGYGRAGLFVDYPSTAEPVTKAQLEGGDIRPTITLYAPWDVTNWRIIMRGARKLLSLVVLQETYQDEQADDGFIIKEKRQWRVLRLVNNVYTVEIWRETTPGSARPYQTFIPTDAAGNTLSEIPFTFLGAENNDAAVDEPPMYDIASLNIAHYRNSADYEESCFMVGQPTPVFSGLTQDWVQNVLKGQVLLGARAAVALPAGGSAELLQANSNTMPFEAMQHKEKQMVALGARIVEQRAVVRTATESSVDHSKESSVLASTAKNVSSGIVWCLEQALSFLGGAGGDSIVFTLNTDFDMASMSPEDRRQLMEEWQSNAVSWDEVRTNLRKSGIVTMDDAQARKLIDNEIAEADAKRQAEAEAAAAKATAARGESDSPPV
jgi:hypothetical protein